MNIQSKLSEAKNSIDTLNQTLNTSLSQKKDKKIDAGPAGKAAKEAISDLLKDRDCLFLPPKDPRKILQD